MSPTQAPMQPIDTPPPAEVGEPEPDALDERIAKEFPEATAEARAAIKARALKRHGKAMVQLEQKVSIADRIKGAPNIEALNLVRVAILHGLGRGTLTPSDKALKVWNLATWYRVAALMREQTRPGEVSYIYNFTFVWPRDPVIRQVIDQTFRECIAALPSDAEWYAQQGIEIVK